MEHTSFDPTRKYVRVTGRRHNGAVELVEFEFSVGEPALAVELIMPEAAFATFCADNRVSFIEASAPRAALPGALSGDADTADFGWTLHDATHQRFR
jgi:phenol hydroxylase P0 protein